MKNEKGFSLIELSIVLIIIGLLVSGITGGASLINSARVRSTMTEVTNYRIAVNTYYSAKDRYPGDTAPVSALANGQILGTEMLTTWTDLESVGAVDKDYDDTISTGDAFVSLDGLGYTKNAAAGWIMGYYDGTDPDDYNAIALVDSGGINTVTDKPLGLVAGTTASGGNLENGTTGINAGAMDTKMDNGTIGTGKVVSVSSTATACTYALTTEGCVPIFNIDL
jgi:prepilin-type N-terminal cleavage/methylation domain-containing protein